jgi:penicillin-binding protein 1A
MMTLNAKTGEIVTMVGGYDFYTNKFNNATQAYRQTGSCFKPFVYTAAVEWGMTPETPVSGAPISIGDWQPHNYDGSLGCADLPMKTALAKSMNITCLRHWAPLKCRWTRWSRRILRFRIKEFVLSLT